MFTQSALCGFAEVNHALLVPLGSLLLNTESEAFIFAAPKALLRRTFRHASDQVNLQNQ